MTVGEITKGVLQVLKGTGLGRKLEQSVERERERVSAREEAHGRLVWARDEQERLPELLEAVAKLEAAREKKAAALRAAVRELDAQVRAARHEYQATADLATRTREKASALLRNTASPLVRQTGPVWHAVQLAMEHVQQRHCLGLDDERFRRIAAMTPLSQAVEDTAPIENARAMVADADRAAEFLEDLKATHDQLSDLQLEVDVGAAAVRAVLDAVPPTCFCGHRFGFEAAVDAALTPPSED